MYLCCGIAENNKIEVKTAAHIISSSVLDQTNTFTTLKLSESSQLPSMSSLQTMKESLADMALANFCQIYGHVREDLGSHQLTPSEMELFKLMRTKIAECTTEDKSVFEHDAVAKPFQSSTTMRSPVEDEEVDQVQPDEAPKTFNDLSAMDLKKKPLKITRNELNENGEMTETSVDVVFPYLAGVNYDQCQSIKVNGGLFTPCLTRPSKGSQFCKSCIKADHKDGIMSQRTNCSMLCYENPKGKKEISFGTWLRKRGLERDEVETKIQELYNVTLPEEYWSVDKSKASRAVKTVSTSSDDEASVEGEKPAPKKRGRPKKAASATSGDEVSADGEKPAPKKRGRPKKISVVSASDAEAGETLQLSGGPIANDELVEEPVVEEPVVEEPVVEEPVVEEPVVEEPAPAAEEPLVEEPVVEEPAPAVEVVLALDEDDGLVSDSDSEDEEDEVLPRPPAAKAMTPPKEPVKAATKKPLKKPVTPPKEPVKTQVKVAGRKDGILYTRSDGRRGVMWNGKECVIDEEEDNEVSEMCNGLEKAIGYWNPETRAVEDEPEE